MRMLRWKHGHTRLKKIRNNYIREKVQVTQVKDKMRCRRWFGHIQSRPPNALVCRCDKITVGEGVKRGEGRPKISWKEVVSKNLQFMEIQIDLEKDRAP